MARSNNSKIRRASQKLRNKRNKLVASKQNSWSKASTSSAKQPSLIPFEAAHRILLVGEGDFSFARSLVEYHHCRSLCATSYDSDSAVLSKYPHAGAHIKVIKTSGCQVEHGIDATKLDRVAGAGRNKKIRNQMWDRYTHKHITFMSIFIIN